LILRSLGYISGSVLGQDLYYCLKLGIETENPLISLVYVGTLNK